MADPKNYRPSNLPTDPGVYRFFDENDRVIYVGKAKNLKNRINSYFGSNLQIKTRRMVKTAARVDWTIVKTDLEAVQLEFTWIKQFNPDFNVQFKDDKSYPYLAINLDVIKSADWVIDLGPEGGSGGGLVVAEGRPEEIIKVSKSYTGKFLLEVLKK